MSIRRTTAFLSVVFVLAACTTGGGGSAAPSQAASQPAASQPAGSAPATACTVGVSWNNFQQPRWAAHDEPGIKDTVEAGGGAYISGDADLRREEQPPDVTTMLSQGGKG